MKEEVKARARRRPSQAAAPAGRPLVAALLSLLFCQERTKTLLSSFARSRMTKSIARTLARVELHLLTLPLPTSAAPACLLRRSTDRQAIIPADKCARHAVENERAQHLVRSGPVGKGVRQVRAERESVDVGELGVDLRAQGRRREQEDVEEGEGERGSSKSAVQDLRVDEKVKNEERKRDARPRSTRAPSPTTHQLHSRPRSPTADRRTRTGRRSSRRRQRRG